MPELEARQKHMTFAQDRFSSSTPDAAGTWHGLDALVESGSVRSYAAGERVLRGEAVDELHLVLEGEVALLSRGDEARTVSVASEGHALELDSLFTGASKWQFDWVCKKSTRISALPRSSLDRLAAAQPLQYRCVERVARHPELAALRDNLRLFGLSDEQAQSVIVSLSCHESIGQRDCCPPGLHLGVVRQGQIDVWAGDPTSRRAVARYLPGEQLTIDHVDDLLFESTPGTSVWVLSRESLIALSGNRRQCIERFLRFIDPRGREDLTNDSEGSVPAATEDARASDRASSEGGPQLASFLAEPTTARRRRRKRYPWVQQHDQMDCGAACMSMVARAYGRTISVPRLRSLVHVTRDGASLFSMKKAAEHLGFQAIGIKARYEDLARYLVPFIALTEYHFVVVYEVTADRIVIGDPSRGIVRQAAQAFKAEWSGLAILLHPTERFKGFPETEPSYQKYLKLLHGLRAPISEALLASLLLFVFGLTPPLFMQTIFDQILPEAQRGLLDLAAVVVLAIAITMHLTEWARDYLLLYVSSRSDAKFASLFLRRVFELPLGFFAVRRVGAITARFGELAQIRRFITGQTVSIIMSVLSTLVYSIVLGFYHVGLLLIVLVTLALTMAFLHSMSPRLKAQLQQIFKAQSRSNGMAFEHFSGFETIKSINGTIAARWRWFANFSKLSRLRRESTRVIAVTSSGSELLNGATNVAVLIASVWFYTRQELTLGQVVASNIIVANITSPILALAGHWDSIQQLGVSFSRIEDVITSAPERTGELEQPLVGRIEFDDVRFQYGSELSPMVLNGVTLAIQAGETVAFVGQSGSGKTTLAHMVSLLYLPSKGRVLLDGVDARSFSLASLRNQVAMVTQDNSLFSGSILENIALGDPDPSFDRALLAANLADAHGFINRLKHKYATQLGEGGSGLSGGQRQRLNIARALYKDPAVLILDEATSSLDAVSERRIMEGLGKNAKSRTTIMIAHRLNTIMHASRIFVFDKGCLVESGTHSSLVQARGQYYRLYQTQLS
jgi:subfamily B ATP-binding cassette protein HlyB/CyaB